jgi:cation diffusion facilitator family transporter
MQYKNRVILISFSISIVLLIVKFFAYYLTSSSAILTDALESIINVVASGFALYSLHLASLPKDGNHPYGHGKIEFFSAGLEGVLIVLASIFIIFHAFQDFVHPTEFNSLGIGLIIIIGGGIVNFLLGYFVEKTGKKENSPTLIADGQHLILDSQSVIILIFAVGVVYFTKIYWIDSVASILFGIYMLTNGIKITRKSVGGLMDETEPLLLNKIVNILKNHRKDTWIDVHNLRIQQYGADIHIDCHLTLPNYWNLEDVHSELHEIEEIVNENTGGFSEIFIHADPCLPECCHYCAIKNCNIRTENQNIKIEWNDKNLTLNQKHFRES